MMATRILQDKKYRKDDVPLVKALDFKDGNHIESEEENNKVHRVCVITKYTPKQPIRPQARKEAKLQLNIFQQWAMFYTNNNAILAHVIGDSGSSVNLISSTLVKLLQYKNLKISRPFVITTFTTNY